MAVFLSAGFDVNPFISILVGIILAFTIVLIIVLNAGCGILSGEKPVIIVYPKGASTLEILAAREIRKYVYLRTGKLLEIAEENAEIKEKTDLIVVSMKDRPLVHEIARKAKLGTLLAIIDPEHYLLKTIEMKKRRVLLITSGDTVGTLYGAYRFAELLGVRFYLHGDVIPDRKIEFELPELLEDSRPIFTIRGILPFHDFPEGPDWWNTDDYKAILSQLPKLGMNFIGLHTYPEGGVGPEPTVWIGLPEDVNDEGTVKFSYPARWFTTAEGGWGYTARNTGEYVFGSNELFEHDIFGPEVMLGHSPMPETPESSNEVFNRTGIMLRETFKYAHMLGIKTCVGTETPLTIPKLLKERLKEKGKNLSNSSVVQELYEGIFSRITKTYDLDYYWFWTPENWTWGGNTEADILATRNDLLAAVNAAEKVRASYTLATCGWVIGPQTNPTYFDRLLPGDMPVSCINRQVGISTVDPAFMNIEKRPKWAIPWLEDDPALTSPQLWAGRMRSDAADAWKYKCTGLIGIHWRTRILGPTVSSLAKAAWDQSKFKEKPVIPGPKEGRVFNYPDISIDGTEDDPLYQAVRSDVSAYRLEVPAGVYNITLKFCEHVYDKKNVRVFGVNIQDEPVINSLDIFAEAGKNTALDFSFEKIIVLGGGLAIDFIRKKDYPSITGIAVENDNFSLKINCGGTDYKDYAADWEKAQPRDLATDDFYDDWALHNFGAEAVGQISQLFQKIDGQLPRPSTWVNGPGGFNPDTREWKEVSKEYEFVSDFEKIRPGIKGAGNMERFDYWLNNFTYMMKTAELNCAWGIFNDAMEKVNVEEDLKAKAALAKNTALPIYKEMVKITGEAFKYFLATVSNYGEMGNIANLNQHVIPKVLGETGKELAEALGENLPDDSVPAMRYSGEARVIVPTLRSSVIEGEVLNLKVIILDKKPPGQAELFWRQMGSGEFTGVSLEHVNRGVYSVQFPSEGVKNETIEYYVRVVTNEGNEIYFPATAPELNQTVVIIRMKDEG
ncbi:MAG TPA: hypothetical protein ENH82_07815 [bacterium]|nr:hypothetical protein [bacterium]